MSPVKRVCLWILGVGMIFAGAMHFIKPEAYVRIMPAALPYPLELVYISGFFEMLGGLGVLIPMTRRAAAWGLIALYLAVFPANINMALNHNALGPDMALLPGWALWARLPVQFVLIAWAYWYTKPEKPARVQ